MKNLSTHSRAAKQLGDFGEGLVTYALICKGYEVAVVDHVGADLIAEKGGNRFAISVKTRRFKPGIKESRYFTVEEPHLNKLVHFSDQFAMTPLFALTACVSDDNRIHLFMARVDHIKQYLRKTQHGYAMNFGTTGIQELISNPFIDYSSWENEAIGQYDFSTAAQATDTETGDTCNK